MKSQKQLEKEGWSPFIDNNMAAVQLIRRVVYLLSNAYAPNKIDNLLIRIGIDHITFNDMEGDSTKTKIINFLCYCQENHYLNDFFVELRKDNQELDPLCENIQQNLVVDICDLAFDIPSNSCCKWYKDYNGERHYENVHQVFVYTEKKHPCRRYDICKICGKVIGQREEHEWGDWKYKSDKNCDKIRICKRCHEEEKKSDEHIWEITNYKNGSSYKKCSHCGQEEISVLGKWKGFVNWDDNKKDFWYITIKERLFGLRDPLATVTNYIDVTDTAQGMQCQCIVILEGSVSIYQNSCVIKCKKIKENRWKIKYNLDTFEGIIRDKCLFIEGTVNDGKKNGKLILEQDI